MEGRGGEREERKKAQLTRDFKQKTKVEKQRQNRIEIIKYRRIDGQQGRGLHTREKGTGVRIKERRKGDVGCFLPQL